MRPRSKTLSPPSFSKKSYFCFICNEQSTEKGLPLLLCETTHSRICLGEKLQEILGDKFIVLITSKDSVCWQCAEKINWVDKYEMKLDLVRDGILTQVGKKYKEIEMCLNREDQTVIDNTRGSGSLQNLQTSNTIMSKTNRLEEGSQVKKKRFFCSACSKSFASAAAHGAHMSRIHPAEFVCEYCDTVFSTEKKLIAHIPVHTSVKQKEPKLLSCVSCGFQAKNTEVYCRHVCNSKIITLVCTTCKKRYIDSSFTKEDSQNFQCPTCKSLYPPENPSEQLITDILEEQEEEQEEEDEEEEEEDGSVMMSEDIQKEAEHITPESNSKLMSTETPTSNVPPEVDDSNLDKLTVDKPLVEPQIENEPTIIQEGSSIIDTMLESNEDPDIQAETQTSEDVSYLKCTNCDEEFELNMLATHQCFVRGDVIEFSEVERKPVDYVTLPMYVKEQEIDEDKYLATNGSEAVITQSLRGAPRRRIPKIPAQENSYVNIEDNTTRMHCKTCNAEFKTIGLMRQHWNMTGHTREVSTTTIELNKIKDKHKKTERTFKVVKQNFNIRAFIPGQNDEELKKFDETQRNCIIRVQNDTSLEDFIRQKDGRECETCGILFGTEEVLKKHQLVNCLTCVSCNITFLDNKLLKKHYQYTGHANRIAQKPPPEFKYETIQEYFHCQHCSRPFQNRYMLGKHLQKHYKGTNKGACHYCQLEFEDKSQIQQHVLECHGAQLFKCQKCDKTFLSESIRNKHEAKHATADSKQKFTCSVCKMKFCSERMLLLHVDKIHRQTSCRICGKLISDFKSLKRHERRHYYEKGLHCDLCGKNFRSKSMLKNHSKVHSDEEQFKCKTCSLGFKSAESLEEHQIVHIKKEYTCPKCSMVCHSRIFFWMHMKQHDTAYMCSVCGRIYRDTSLLAIHRRKHWRVRPYQCHHCTRAFSVPATLRRHLAVHTRTYPHKCVLCKRGFLTRYAFYKHLDKAHSVNMTMTKKTEQKIPSLPLNATDEDLFQAADTLIAEDSIMFEYGNIQQTSSSTDIEQVPSSELITNEVIVETTELFDHILN